MKQLPDDLERLLGDLEQLLGDLELLLDDLEGLRGDLYERTDKRVFAFRDGCGSFEMFGSSFLDDFEASKFV